MPQSNSTALFWILTCQYLFLRTLRQVQSPTMNSSMCMNTYDYNHGGTGNIAASIKMGASNRPTTQCPIFEYTINGVNIAGRAINL